MRKIEKASVILLFAVILASCSSIKRYDDAVRIKKERADQYDYYYKIEGDDTLEVIPRNSYTLRGTVINLVKMTYPESCDEGAGIDSTYYLTFLYEQAADEDEIEMIPVSDVRLIGPELDIETNDYGNINYFENFNDPLDPRAVREVPVDSIHIDTCGRQCNCGPLRGPALPHINVDIKCPDCDYKHYFVELRGMYSAYNDYETDGAEVIAREGWSAEIAAGYRTEKWGIGLAYSSGIPVHNKFSGTDFWRPSLMLHGRYHFEPFSCINPFLYGQFGMAIDEFSLDLGRVSFCEDCNNEIDIEPPGADISIPLSYGIGAGIDIPLTGCFFDLSFDLGYRSLAIGETFETFEFTNVPSKRRIHMLVFRMGITLGY